MVGRPTRRPDRTTAVNSGRRRRRACAGNTSGGELLATLAPTAGDDGPARAGAHTQPEAVGLGPAAVVRLERALAHEVLLRHDIGGRVPAGGRTRAGCRWGRRGRRPGDPRKLVPAAGSDLPARRLALGARTLTARNPSTDSDQHSRGRERTGGAPGRDSSACIRRPRPTLRRAGERAVPTRRESAPDRCRAVDRAVSVAVAPRRASGFRRAGRPRRRIAAPSTTSRARQGSDQRRRVVPVPQRAGRRRWRSAVHSLWTLMWNACVWASTAGGPRPGCAGGCRRVPDGEAARRGLPDAAGRGANSMGRNAGHDRCHAGPGDGLGPDP